MSHPVIEPYVLPASPYEAFAAGRQNDVPTLIGFNAEEPRAFVDTSAVTAANFVSDPPGWWPARCDRLPCSGRSRTRPTRRRAPRGSIWKARLRYGWDVWAWARLTASRGKGAVYAYRFDHRPPFPANSIYAHWGAAHYTELWYVFDHLDQEPWAWTPADRRLADEVSGYWTNFIKHGDPNGPGLPAWPRFTSEHEAALHLDEPVKAGAFPATQGLQTIDHLYTLARGAPFGADRTAAPPPATKPPS